MEDMIAFLSATLVFLAIVMAIFFVRRIRERSVHDFAPVQTPVEMLQHSHWYEKPFLLILAIVLICPIGLYGLYKHFELSRRRRLEMIC